MDGKICFRKGPGVVDMSVEVGKKYGRFTVISETEKRKDGKYFRCRCECGNEADYPASVIRGKPNRHCKKCMPHTGGLPEPDYAGQLINGWAVLEKVDRVNGLVAFRCRCMRCGAESIHTAAVIRASKGNRCKDCARDYRFVIHDGVAIGCLGNGNEFLIDAADIELVSQKTWRTDKDGYICHSSKSGQGNLLLHRYLVGVTSPAVLVDHINRDRRDCRRENLRIISPFGNSCNHKLFGTNKTGYTGVYYSRNAGRYEVKVGYNHKRIRLGSSPDDLITLAQMYNIGAQFFFGEYAGELNDVPPPTEELIQRVIAKCQKYKEAPAVIAGASAM